MKIEAKETIIIDKGTVREKEIFTKGRKYYYWFLSSTWQNKLVEPNPGTGQAQIFNEEEFYKYFKV